MKTLLRTTALTAALALSVFAMTGHASITNPNGTCRTICYNPSTQTISQVSWFTTESTCCSGTVNPCPAGSVPRTSSFQPTGGFTKLCGPIG
ncbi:MAG TPA: hypothetical protein VGM86_28790 [Thermoanaerobaculia bacterium]|jgi:hypothetical protein